MRPVAERIFLYKDDRLVSFASLTKKEKEHVKNEVSNRLTDSLMASQGYTRSKVLQKDNT